MTIKQAIKIIEDDCNHLKHHLTEKGKAPEFYQELCDTVIAYNMAISALEQIDKIKQIIAIDNSVIQEDVLKYKMICEVLNDK